MSQEKFLITPESELPPYKETGEVEVLSVEGQKFDESQFAKDKRFAQDLARDREIESQKRPNPEADQAQSTGKDENLQQVA